MNAKLGFGGVFVLLLSGCGNSGGMSVTDPRNDGGEAANCRWLGYGIGAPPEMQCNQTHLWAHATEACMASGGGFPARDGSIAHRTVAGACTSEVQEVQVFCCYEAGIPSPADPPMTMLLPRDRSLLATGAATSSEDLIAGAASTCTAEQKRLGDWSILYGPDGSSPAFIQFYCL